MLGVACDEGGVRKSSSSEEIELIGGEEAIDVCGKAFEFRNKDRRLLLGDTGTLESAGCA